MQVWFEKTKMFLSKSRNVYYSYIFMSLYIQIYNWYINIYLNFSRFKYVLISGQNPTRRWATISYSILILSEWLRSSCWSPTACSCNTVMQMTHLGNMISTIRDTQSITVFSIFYIKFHCIYSKIYPLYFCDKHIVMESRCGTVPSHLKFPLHLCLIPSPWQPLIFFCP